MAKEQWHKDIQWLVKHRYPGRGGYKALAADLDTGPVTPALVGYWVRGERTPEYENQKALRAMRERGGGPK